MLVCGRPMVEAVIERFSPQVDGLVISANRELGRYRAYGVPVVTDILPDAGPLGGILAALTAPMAVGHRWLATVPCDSPALPQDLVERLLEAARRADACAAVASCRGRIHPVFALLERGVESRLARFLDSGDRRLGRWYASIDAIEVPFEDEQAFINLNSRAELTAFEESRH